MTTRTLSEPARSTKWNLETIVTQSPVSSSMLPARSPPIWPRALAGRRLLPLPMAIAKLGVAGRPIVGEATLLLAGEGPPAYIEPGRASLEGERPPGGRGDEDRGGCPEPEYFFCVKVREKMACDREDCAFMSVSFVRRIELPFLSKLQKVRACYIFLVLRKAAHLITSWAFLTLTSRSPPHIIWPSLSSRICTSRLAPFGSSKLNRSIRSSL